MKKKVLALIPARSGSKRLKNKNILEINNKPLIYYTISKSLKSKYINYTLVSTDSSKISKVSTKFGAKVPFLRPKRLSKDKSKMIDVIKHSVNFLEKKKLYFDYVILLQPSSPLRKSSHIDEAIKFFDKISDKANSLFSVSHSKTKNWVGSLTKQNKLKGFNISGKKDFENYTLNGSIYIFKTSYIKKVKKLDLNKTYGFIIDKKYSLDIDCLYQFKICKLILEKKDKYFI